MKELPQNLKTALQEIGELSGLLYLHMLIDREGLSGWKVFRNYADEGCDIVLMGPKSQINVEVKTRQTISASGDPNTCHFTVTSKEKESSQFILAYWFNKSTFFVVPTTELKPVTSNEKTLYKFIARYSEQNTDFTSTSRCFAHDWERIAEVMRNA